MAKKNFVPEISQSLGGWDSPVSYVYGPKIPELKPQRLPKGLGRFFYGSTVAMRYSCLFFRGRRKYGPNSTRMWLQLCLRTGQMRLVIGSYGRFKCSPWVKKPQTIVAKAVSFILEGK